MIERIDPLIFPDWCVPASVRALMTTRAFGDMAGGEGRERLRALACAAPAWLRQVHGTRVVDAAEAHRAGNAPEADAAIARDAGAVCVVRVADCMPVLLAHRGAEVVGAAHAGWRGLCAGILDATLDAMRVAPQDIVAWLGPAIGPGAYEVGDEVREAFFAENRAPHAAFAATRDGHWRLDLYAVARAQLARRGVREIHGGDFCTFSDPGRFFSFRRSRDTARMAAAIWLT